MNDNILKWDATSQEFDLIDAIANRAVKLAAAHGVAYPKYEALMDVTSAHRNAYHLRLGELLEADDFNFAHDVFGIRRHLNRETGRLEDCFVPRYAA
jgi:hypothetical protein